MIAEFTPSIAYGTFTAPPSKSMTHRFLLPLALAEEPYTIENASCCEDTRATADCVQRLSKDSAFRTAIGLSGDGCEDSREPITLNCKESGSTLRFLLPLCLISGRDYILTGSKRLLQRPLSVYEEICRAQGLLFENDGSAVHVRGPLRPGHFTFPGNISSQFATGLLYALPLLKEDSDIDLLKPVESRPYIDMTLEALRRFGINVAEQKPSDESVGLSLAVPGRQRYRSADVIVEGDCSAAAFFAALNLLGGDVTVEGIRKDTLQGDRIYPELFGKLSAGCPEIDLSDVPDLAPILFVLAELLHGASFTGTEKLKYKESDRLLSMSEELSKYKKWRDAPAGAPRHLILSSHNDHRVAMALAILLSHTGGTLTGAECVNKSFPEFFERLRALGINPVLR